MFPFDNEKQTSKMRKILSSDEIYKLIQKYTNEDLIVENDGEKKRNIQTK